MIDAAIIQTDLLDLLTEAYAGGNAPRGEALLHEALDAGLPWDEVCAAAALGTARRYGERNVA